MTILCYHSVDPDWRSPLAVSPEEFSAHCGWLASRRTVLPLAEAVQRLDASALLPRGCTALTFDDGYAGLYSHAAPALRRFGLPATVFLVAETLTAAGRAVDWADRPPPSGTLTLDQVREMREAGVAFGSHSYAHRDLTALDETACERDLRASRELLEELLGCPVTFLAYPGGRHNEAVRRAAERAGYSHAFSLPDAGEARGPYAIPRAGVYPGNGPAALRLKTSRSYVSLRASPIFPVVRGAARLLSRSGPPPV